LPHLKFSRDKKGYEHTSLVRPARKGGREGRILYWFRTPPHVKVGRSALDEDAIRLIEQYHPDITFDWPRILKTQPVVVEEPHSQKADTRESRKRKGQPRSQGEKITQAPTPSRGATPVSEREPMESIEPEAFEPVEPLEAVEPAGQIQELKQPTMIEAAVQENGDTEWEAPVEAEPLDRSSEEGEGVFLSPRPLEALVGAEGVERLRARHAALLAAISEGVDDVAKREFLRTEAERLDPDSWVTIDAARAALETYESDYETIRRQLPPRRRRRRRGRRSKTHSLPRQRHSAGSAEQGHTGEVAQVAEPDNGSGNNNGSDEPEP
jgi:hypothetical protein